ncbi:MAG: hypothetical protein ACJ8H8_24715, partial [Geminicoccaceae bacterium]
MQATSIFLAAKGRRDTPAPGFGPSLASFGFMAANHKPIRLFRGRTDLQRRRTMIGLEPRDATLPGLRARASRATVRLAAVALPLVLTACGDGVLEPRGPVGAAE